MIIATGVVALIAWMVVMACVTVALHIDRADARLQQINREELDQ